MVAFVKKTETINNVKRTFYHFLTGIKLNDSEIIMDATDRLREANKRDKHGDYGIEDGPHFGIEVARAQEYLEYVKQHATPENYFKFNTRPSYKGKDQGGYTFFPQQEGKSS